MAQPIAFTDTSGRFQLPFLFAGQAQKEFFVNEAHALTDMLLHTTILGELAGPPSESVDGDIWLVASGAIGEWACHDGDLAGRQAGLWKFITPRDGMRIFDSSIGQFALHSGGWVRAAPPTIPATGQTVDSELRDAFDQLIEALRNAGIFPVTE
ncbi:DUF2793 domain-containing protein [Pontixanthobacter aestiaquae]|uniref:DUF2793 domain-containing protein n=1 Tax=Pontixanthobacter aestiaquae TaxID=1509367 RepID=A0A844Z4C1_9SPHN|nr:DUF2793 domain-containing protein [Pontixanthobacter aestiaquae]MDN3647075.1 DUF2793 domain-containing protein [Pontixanthobacter aestiaquae]MXO81947.1 DUF2793 domain-containing protein [Pontixanthobacter aestiaquae]